MTQTARIHNILTIAGTDPSGGAGIQADLKTFSALGTYGTSVVTALVAQNTHGVRAVQVCEPAFVAAQLDAVFDDLRIDAVKIGMVANAGIIDVIAERLIHHKVSCLILDPVMVATSGDRLLAEAAVTALRRRLLPLASLITPNLPEAAVLLGRPLEPRLEAMRAALPELLAAGSAAVLLKGGHMAGLHSTDLFFDGTEITELKAPRIATRNTHGTGCTLSAAIAALTPRLGLAAAVRAAKSYLTAALAAADQLDVGSGHGPVHHFHALWPAAQPGLDAGPAANDTRSRSDQP